MAMASLNISLPDLLKAYVEEQVATGDFGTPSEFVRSLIREDKERRQQRLESELLHALKTRQFKIAPEELADGNLVAALRRKLAEG